MRGCRKSGNSRCAATPPNIEQKGHLDGKVSFYIYLLHIRYSLVFVLR